jgi:hypothetical protein
LLKGAGNQVLLDLTLDNLDERFEMGDFTQQMPGPPQRSGQVPYDEALLSADGAEVVARKINCTRGLLDGRIAFYFHYYDPSKPMLRTYGEFSSPNVEIIPQRLWNLIPYHPVD